MPRMNLIERNTISSPATGLIIYQTNGTPGYYFYDGSAWQPLNAAGVDNLGNHEYTQNMETGGFWLSGDTDNEGVFVTDNGQVGVGTDSPDGLFQVEAGSSTDPFLMRGMRNSGVAGELAGIGLGVQGGTDVIKSGIVHERESANGAGKLHLLVDNSTDANDVSLAESRMTIDRYGRVGIGTTSPSEELHVTNSGDVQILIEADPDNISDNDHPKLMLTQDGGTVQGWFGFESEGSNDNNLFIANKWNNAAGDIRFRTRNITRMTLDGDGKLGHGTKNPMSNYHMYGNATSGFVLGGTSVQGNPAEGPEIGLARGGFYNGLGASIQFIDYDGYSGGLAFNVHKGVYHGAGGAFADNWPLDVIQAMTIMNNGNIGVGTADPKAKLEVIGDARITDLAGSGTRMVVADANGDLSTQAIPSGGGGSIDYVERSSTSTTFTTSSNYGTINGMYATPAAGTYMVTFSASGYGDTNGQDMYVALYTGSSKIGHTEREYGMDSGSHADDLRRAIHTQAVVVVNGSQQISAKFKEIGGTFRIKERSMSMIKLN